MPNAFAKDFEVTQICKNGSSKITITDENGLPLQKASIFTLKKISDKKFEKEFTTNEDGVVGIKSTDNYGFIKISKPGFNDQKIVIKTCANDEVPSWIKNNAKWWTQKKINDATLIEGFQFMIEKNILKVPKNSSLQYDCLIHQIPKNWDPTKNFSTDCKILDAQKKIPDWVSTNTKWWVDGVISDSEFLKGIEYLVTANIIEINSNKSNNSQIDSKFPSIEILKDLNIDDTWLITTEFSTDCSAFGTGSNRQMHLEKSNKDRMGIYTEFTSIDIDFCNFNKINIDKIAKNEPGLENTYQSIYDYYGYSELTGNCYLDKPKLLRFPEYFIVSSGGCSNDSFIVRTTIKSFSELDEEFTIRTIEKLMDTSIQNIYSENTLSLNYSFLDTVGLIEK